MKRNVKFVLPIGICAGACFLMGGCYTSNIKPGESLSAIRDNPAPGLASESQRYTDVGNMYAVTNNDNLRKMTSDWNRFWLMDRPSRDSPYPITR